MGVGVNCKICFIHVVDVDRKAVRTAYYISAEDNGTDNRPNPSTYKPPAPSYTIYNTNPVPPMYGSKSPPHSPVPQPISVSNAPYRFEEQRQRSVPNQSPHRHPYTSYPYNYPEGRQPEYPAPPIPVPTGSLGHVGYEPMYRTQQQNISSSYDTGCGNLEKDPPRTEAHSPTSYQVLPVRHFFNTQKMLYVIIS